MEETLKPCERITFVHYCLRGPRDGDRTPSEHCYDTLTIGGDRYRRCGDATRMSKGPPGLEVLNCTDDYFEPVFFRVEMVYDPTPGASQ